MGTSKTAAGVRTIPVTNTLKEALLKHKQLHIKLFNKTEGYVFKTNSGMEYHSRTSFDKELKRICKENNLPIITIVNVKSKCTISAGVMYVSLGV